MLERPTQFAIDRFRREVAHVRFEGDDVAVFLINACNDVGRISETNRALCFMAADRINELRRECCVWEAMFKFRDAHPKGTITNEVTLRMANEIAVERGWDCFRNDA